MLCRISRVGLSLLGLVAVVSIARAVIAAPTSLAAKLKDTHYIVVTKVDKLLPERPALVLTVEEDLKGKFPLRRLPINAKGDADAEKLGHIPKLMKRLAPGLPVVLLVNHRGKFYNTFAFTNGTWFFLQGQQVGPDEVAWSLLHGEPNLRQAYAGTTDQFRKLLMDVLAGKAEPPAMNPKEEPGFGPEAAPAGKTGRVPGRVGNWCMISVPAGHGLFGVIPTLGVGGPLAILALLFPAVFGGVLVLFRQWIAFITVLSLNSTLLLLLWLWPNLLRGTWWNSPPGLWTIVTLITLFGTMWAWRRQLTNLALGPLAPEAPRKTEYTVLASLSAVCLAIIPLTLWLTKPEAADLSWNLTLVLAAGIWGGLLYKLYRHAFGTQPPLATEGVMCAVTLLACVLVGALRWGHGGAAEGHVESAPLTAAVGGVQPPKFLDKRWVFEPSGDSGLFVSTALVEGDRVYAAAAHPAFKVGTLFCIDRDTGKEVWNFIDDGALKQMLSSPCLAEGRLYLGEGFHDDPRCKLYCLDPKDGKKLWEFETTGQTESSPCVAGGKVYVGGGNDGLYCLDAASGKKLWLFSKESAGRLLRFGAPPAVASGKVYCGSGVDRNEKEDQGETAVFCLDADSGKLVWKTPVPLPCWGAPVIVAGKVYLGLGNGDVFNDAESPAKKAGQVICLDAATGKEVWRYDLPNGVIGTVAVDAEHVYAGCRDGNVYCLGRPDGKTRWQTDMGSPVIATPGLARCPGYEQTAHVFAIGTKGKVACLDPHTGQALWTYTLPGSEMHLSSSPRVVVSRTTEGDRRQIYFGAGLGGLTTGRPVVYCLEDLVKVQ